MTLSPGQGRPGAASDERNTPERVAHNQGRMVAPLPRGAIYHGGLQIKVGTHR